MRSVEFLKRLQQEKGLNAAGVARLLNLTEGGISHYFKGKRVMNDETCLAVALELGIDPMQVLGAAFLDRAEQTGQKSLWEVFLNRTAMTTGAVLLASGVNLFLTPAPANAASMRVPADQVAHSIDYAKNRNRRRRITDLRKTAVCTWLERVFGSATLEPAAR